MRMRFVNMLLLNIILGWGCRVWFLRNVWINLGRDRRLQRLRRSRRLVGLFTREGVGELMVVEIGGHCKL